MKSNESDSSIDAINQANPLIGATLSLSPADVGPNVTGTAQTLSATLRDASNNPLPNRTVTFTVTGVNAATGTASTNASGAASFVLTGVNNGLETVKAAVTENGTLLESNNATVTWITPAQAISTSTVTGRFFVGTTSGAFDIPATQQPVFTQYFPTVNFNPAPNTVINQPADVNTYTRPMVNVTTDTAGNYTGKITVEGNGYQAGLEGNLMPVAGTFTANFNVAAPMTVTFNFYSDDGFYFGIGNGATRVSGVNTDLPASGLTAHHSLPIMGGYNRKTAPLANSITVNFPAAGTYPYEIDWADCCQTQMALTMTTSLTGKSVPPSGSVVLTPSATTAKYTGQTQTLTATVTDAAGAALANQPVTFRVTGANPQQTNVTTNASGQAVLTLTGTTAGADRIQVSGQITGMQMYSNAVQQEWILNNPPTVNAGADQTVVFPVTVNLNGTAIDDGNPAGSTLTSVWNKVSGPGTVTFANPNALQTTASFSVPGVYELSLTVNDSLAATTDSLIVNAQSPTVQPTANFKVAEITGPIGLTVIDFSTNQASNPPKNLIDETYYTSWQSVSGQVSNQFVKFQVEGGSQIIDRFRLQNYSTGYGLKSFIIQVSDTTAEDAAFTTVLTSEMQTSNSTQPQEFALSQPIHAKFIKLKAVSAFNNGTYVNLAAFQAIGLAGAENIVSLPGTINVARNGSPSLLANGAAVTRVSESGSSYAANGALLEASSGWYISNAPNQFLVVRLAGNKSHRIKSVRVSGFIPAAYNSNWVKDFEVWVSNTVDEDSAFTKVLTATKTTISEEEFLFPGGAVDAKYVKYVPKNSENGSEKINTGHFEVVSEDQSGVIAVSSVGGLTTASSALDQANNTFWQSAQNSGTNQWLKIKLTGNLPQQIYGVKILGSSTGPKDFQIRVSTTTSDNSAFTTFHSGTLANSSTVQEVRFASPVSAKYVQFYFLNGYSAQIISTGHLEVLAIPNDGALITQISSQISDSAGAIPEELLDLNKSSIDWVTVNGQNTNQSLKLRLYNGELFNINHISLTPGFLYSWSTPRTGMSPREFEIQVSTTNDDDASFTTAFAGTMQSVETAQHFYFPTVAARYVRLFIKNNYGDPNIGVRSFYVYAENTGSTNARFFDRTVNPDNVTISYNWDFGDGTSSTERNPQHNYAQPGTYLVRLTVTDNLGRVSTAEKSYIALPELKADFSYSPLLPREGIDNVYFFNLSSARLTSRRGRDELKTPPNSTFTWSNSYINRIYSDNGLYSHTIRIGSDLSVLFQRTKEIQVSNIAPTVDIENGKTVFWGEQWTNTPTIGDVSSVDASSLSGTWTFGDGQTTACTNCTNANAKGIHAYNLPGIYNPSLEIRDKDGATASDSTSYTVIKRITGFVFQTPVRNGDQLTVRAQLRDLFGNVHLSTKPIRLKINGVVYERTTDANGYAEVVTAFPSTSKIERVEASFQEDALYQASSYAYMPPPSAETPSEEQSNVGRDFWIMFPQNYSSDTRLFVLIASKTNTSGTITATGCNTSKNFQVVASAVASIELPAMCQQGDVDQIKNLGIRITAQEPIAVYGLNQRQFSTDAFLAYPITSLGKDYYVLTYGNHSPLTPSTQFGIVAVENNTTVTITPSVDAASRVAGVPFNVTLNQGQTYLLRNSIEGIQNDLTGSRVISNKPVGVFTGHRAAILPPPATCCGDHIVEQMPSVDTWGKRFVLIASASHTKGDLFRFVAAYDNTSIYLNGKLEAVINRGRFYEKIIQDSIEVIATEPILVGQFGVSSGFAATTAVDPYLAIVPPYTQYLNRYVVTTPATGFAGNYLNLAVPTSAIGQIMLNGNAVPGSNFTQIGTSGFSSARLPVPLGVYNLFAPVPFGVFSYGFNDYEGYGYAGGMNLRRTTRGTNIAIAPETAARIINSQSCVTATLTDENQHPLGANTVSFTATGVHTASGNASTDAAGRAEFCYTGTTVGTDTITASATTTVGNATGSASVVWTLPNQAPAVNAGADQTITLPATASLNGTATDDNLPANTLNAVWSKVSGAGNVSFSNVNALNTTAAFSQSGTYVLRLTVSDTALTGSDDLTVTVNAEPPNQPPVADAGTNQTVFINANLISNPGAEAELVNNELLAWTEAVGTNWTRATATSNSVPLARFGEYSFTPSEEATAELTQDVDVRALTGGINAGTQYFEFKTWIRSKSEAAIDGGRVLLEYRDAANQIALGELTSSEITVTDAWQLVEDTRVPPAGTGFIRIKLRATRYGGGASNDVFFDAVSLRALGTVASAKLNGAVNDDGLPSNGNLTAAWTKVSGAGAVAFSDSAVVNPSAAFDAAGTYSLRLTANDGSLSAADNVNITVNPANQAPAVDVGVDQTIQLPAAASLSAAVTDDGNPAGGSSVFVRWEKASGPGTVVFGSATAVNTTASFNQAGVYVLRLLAEDGDLEGSDYITVTVNPGVVNQAPAVDAGANQTIVLPQTSANLAGTASDDGLPSGSTLQTTWTKTSGPGDVVFADQNAPTTAATFTAEGTYVLRLTATDGVLTSFDEVSIILAAAPPTNQPPAVNAGSDQTITLAQQAALVAQVSDDGLPNGTLTASWSKVSGAGAVTFTQPNNLATYAGFSQTGTYVLRLTVSDGALSTTDDVTVTVVNNVPPPVAEILTPEDGAVITKPTALVGNVSGGNWRVEYALQTDNDLNNLQWTVLAQGTGAVTNNTLATLDSSLMMNGTYAVRLVAADQYGQTASDAISVVVEGNLKVGHFTVSFEDMNVPVEGIPIQVIRTYDSRDKRRGDFGYGWTLGVKNLRVEKTTNLGLHWYETRTSTAFPRYCVQGTKPHIVSAVMPDGKVHKFEAKVTPECQNYAPIQEARVVFVPLQGAQGRLDFLGSNEVRVAGSIPGPVQLVGYSSGVDIFDAARFRYTAKDGTQFVIDQKRGLQSARDTNGNTLTVTDNGIFHSSGKSVSFLRDANGRITQMTDPNGNVQTYTYDANGDLDEYKDRENNITKFDYEPTIPHHLKTIVDPLNRQAIRNEYDADGRLLKHVDVNGEEILYTHNLAARVELVRDRLNNETRYEYDERGNVLKKTDALNGETTYSYDANDNVLTETNALGKITVYTYDGFDNRTSVKDPLNNTTTFTYNGLGQVLTATDPRGKTTTNTYDTAGNLLSTTDADGKTTVNGYNLQNGRLSSTKDALNNTTAYDYFLNGLLKSETDALGRVTNYTYDNNGNRLTETRTRTLPNTQTETLTTTFEYDKLNRVTKTIYPDNTFTTVEYNATGQQQATVDQLARRTEFDYDEQGRLVRTTYPDNTFEESTYDDEGRRLTSKDRLNRTTSFAYDELGRLIKTTYPDATFTETTYDPIGQVKTSKDARNNVTTYFYDDAGRRTQVKNALNQITEFTYDAAGNQLSMKDARNNTTAFEYDNLSRRKKTVFPDNTFTTTEYDALGRRTAEVDQAGKRTEFFYDKLGRLTKVKDAIGAETQYGYNEVGQQITQIDALNRITKYEYDKLGRRTKRILPLGQAETYTYFDDGSLKTKTDFNNKTTTFAYDTMQRLLSKTPDVSFNQAAITFTYNAMGQRETMTDGTGTTTFGYDNRNRLQSKQTPFGTLSYTYDEAGNLLTTRSSNTNGYSVDYSYDELNRLKTVKDNRITVGNSTTSYNYDDVGNLQNYQYPNQITTSYNYNSLNRLTAVWVSNATSNLASYEYTLGAAGNRTSVREGSGRLTTYSYDDNYRLITETTGGGSAYPGGGVISYTYDAVGNRLSRTSDVSNVQAQTFTYNNNDRAANETYDANGNTTGQNSQTYRYDYENRITAHNPQFAGHLRLIYDGDGNLIGKFHNNTTTNYLVDTNNHTGYSQIVEEVVSGAVTKQFTYGHDLISQRIISGNVLAFYQYDGHGSVRHLTNPAGAITDTYVYDAFGVHRQITNAVPNDYLYAGERYDAHIKYYYLRARHLNQQTGRFLSMDTYEGNQSDPVSLHKYLYANANPANMVDPSGNVSTLDLVGAFNRSLAVISTIGTALVKAIQEAKPDRVVNGIVFVRNIATATFARAGNYILTYEEQIVGATNKVDLIIQRVRGLQSVNILVEGKGIPYFLLRTQTGWNKFLIQLTNQAQAFSNADKTVSGVTFSQRVIVFSSRPSPQIQQQIQNSIGRYYDQIFWSIDDYLNWLQ